MEKQKTDVKQEIIRKAREILSRFGYRGASTEMIARSLNRTKGALYHYFKNRDDIIKSVIDYEGRRILDTVMKSVEKEAAPDMKLFRCVMTRASEVKRLFSYYGSVIEEYFMRYQFIVDALGEYSAQEQSMVEEILKEGADRGVFSVNDPALTSRALLKAMSGYDFFIFQGGKYSMLEKEITEALSIFIRGISVR